MRAPKQPTVTAPPPPEPPPAKADALVVQNEEREKLRRKRGRASTILTGNSGMGDTTAPVTATTTLLGG